MDETRIEDPENKNRRERNTRLGAFVVALEFGAVASVATEVLSNDLIFALSAGAFIMTTTFITELMGKKPS